MKRQTLKDVLNRVLLLQIKQAKLDSVNAFY